jgi:hypothetical protein
MLMNESTRRYEHPPNSHCPTDDTIWRAGMCSCDQGRTHGGSRFFWLAGPVSFFGLSVLFLLGGWADEGEDENTRWDERETLACGATPPRHRALFSVTKRSATGSLRVLVSLRGMRGPRQRQRGWDNGPSYFPLSCRLRGTHPHALAPSRACHLRPYLPLALWLWHEVFTCSRT